MGQTKKDNKKTEASDRKAEEVFDIDEISSLLKLLKDNDVTDFKLERSGERISLKRGAERIVQAPVAVQPLQAAIQSPSQVVQAPVQSLAPVPNPTEASATPSASSNIEEIKSPMVGTFYTKAAPDADVYVSVGDIVKKGDTLCIIEAMKIMNEIESEKSGRIVEICLEDGQMAEYEEPLFKIEPA
jgi:acetyl-CoA carboxylase biotin carboxyl carrier protein